MPEPPLILRDDFKAFSKIRIENMLYNECVYPPPTCTRDMLMHAFPAHCCQASSSSKNTAPLCSGICARGWVCPRMSTWCVHVCTHGEDATLTSTVVVL